MTVPFVWQRWAAASLLSGMAVDDVVVTMVREGLDQEAAAQTCDELVQRPAYAAGSWATQRLNKLESTLGVLATSRASTVTQRHGGDATCPPRSSCRSITP